MKTKYKYFYLIAFLITQACKKEIVINDRRVCCFTSEIEGTFNGHNWQRNDWLYGAVNIDATQTVKETEPNYKCLEGLVGFAVGLHTKEFFARESLILSKVPKIAKKYGVALTDEYREPCSFSRDSIKTSFVINILDGDVISDTYQTLDKKYPNSFEVVSYEPIKNEFNCRFDFAFIKTRKFDPSYPDTLYLKGKFRIEGRLKQ